jgi:hypothetical protein
MAEDETSGSVDSDSDLPDIPEQMGGEPAETASSPASSEPQASVSPLDVFRSQPGYEGASDQDIVSRIQETMAREQQAMRALQQYQSVIPVASEYLSNREMYEQWKQSRNQPQQPQASAPAAPQKDPWWNPPKVKDSYKQWITRDESGREVISEQAPLEARAALADYQAYKADFARKFIEDPQGAIGPMVEQIVADRAREIAEQQISGLKEETFVSQIEQENKDWLYDQGGHVSREGLLVQKYIEDARGQGINGAKARWDYATAMVERDLALANLQNLWAQSQGQAPNAPQQPPPVAPQATAAQQNMDFLRNRATRAAPRRANPASSDSRNPKKPMSFEDRMRSALSEMGLE